MSDANGADMTASQGDTAEPASRREYVADMAAQLAGMALSDGDRTLAKILEAASEIARRSPQHS